MYHELTPQQIKRRSIRRITGFFIVLALALICGFTYANVSANLHEQGAASVRQAILDAAMQCCAVEGTYPSSLQHLEDDYGLSINHDDYVITYEVFAGNVAPSVVVIAR